MLELKRHEAPKFARKDFVRRLQEEHSVASEMKQRQKEDAEKCLVWIGKHKDIPQTPNQ